MNIIHLTPGAGDMYCGGCFRDNALVAALRKLGHSTLMLPLYLPLNLEDADQSNGAPVFFSGINVYLEQHLSLFGKAPRWLHRMFASRNLLRWVGRFAAKTHPEKVGDLTLSMLQGEDGRQRRELEELTAWLRQQPPSDIICLSNALLIGMARHLKARLGLPVVCALQGEDGFLDNMPESHRQRAWEILRQRARDIDLFIAPSHFFARLMGERLDLPPHQVRVVYNGIPVADTGPAPAPPAPPVLGFFARLCHDKGIDILVEAFLILKQRNRLPGLRLKMGGSLGPSDQPLVQQLEQRLKSNGAGADYEIRPNLDRAAKQAFYQSLSVLSVPVRYNEAFGLYVLEALAAGVPVVLPHHAAFPELVEKTRGGVIYQPATPEKLADALESLLLDPARAQALGRQGRDTVLDQFSSGHMARHMATVYQEVIDGNPKAHSRAEEPVANS